MEEMIKWQISYRDKHPLISLQKRTKSTPQFNERDYVQPWLGFKAFVTELFTTRQLPRDVMETVNRNYSHKCLKSVRNQGFQKRLLLMILPKLINM